MLFTLGNRVGCDKEKFTVGSGFLVKFNVSNVALIWDEDRFLVSAMNIILVYDSQHRSVTKI